MQSKRRSKPSKKTIKAANRPCLLTACVLLVVSLLPGCTILHKQTPEQRAAEAAARELLSHLATANENLQDFKGIGRIQLAGDSAAYIDQRMVWAGSLPTKLSVVVLASGLPVLKFASDGQHLYFLDMRSSRSSFRKIRSSDPQLDRLISIPVRSSDIVLLLAGRLPVRSHSKVSLATNESGSRVLILQKWWRVVQRITVDPQRSELQSVEFFDGQGKLAYRVTVADLQTIQGYRVPRQIRIDGSSGAWLAIRAERIYPNADIKPEVFILAPPDRDSSAAMR